eukprot:365442-Chlamydomonas_euryale.AAC.15
MFKHAGYSDMDRWLCTEPLFHVPMSASELPSGPPSLNEFNMYFIPERVLFPPAALSPAMARVGCASCGTSGRHASDLLSSKISTGAHISSVFAVCRCVLQWTTFDHLVTAQLLPLASVTSDGEQL